MLRGQRGEGRLGMFVFLALLAGGIFIGTRAIPVRIAVLQLHDYIDEQSRMAAASSRPDKARVIKNILERAKELEIPLDPKKLEYKRSSGSVIIKVKHRITIDLAVYEWTWSYDEEFEHMRI